MSLKHFLLATSVAIVCYSNTAIANEISSKEQKVIGTVNMGTINLQGDTLFKLGDDKLSASGKKALDALLKKGSLFPNTRYRIEGHTDNIGDKWDNGKLSLRRAESVRQYLLSKDRNLQLEVGGVGEAQPLVECSDKLPKEKLVKCLAPNRRVTIEEVR
jgi:OOP family OmpA-OmpF porin